MQPGIRSHDRIIMATYAHIDISSHDCTIMATYSGLHTNVCTARYSCSVASIKDSMYPSIELSNFKTIGELRQVMLELTEPHFLKIYGDIVVVLLPKSMIKLSIDWNVK